MLQQKLPLALRLPGDEKDDLQWMKLLTKWGRVEELKILMSSSLQDIVDRLPSFYLFYLVLLFYEVFAYAFRHTWFVYTIYVLMIINKLKAHFAYYSKIPL